MAKFLKNLKGLFIATDEDLIKAEQAKMGESTKGGSTTTPGPSTQTTGASEDLVLDKTEISADADGTVDQKFLDILLESVTKNNQEGYDYLEFKQALQSLKKMDMDDATRFKSAFAMAQTMGATKASLLDTGAIYLKVLKSEEEKFTLSVANQRQSKIDERKQELLNIDKWIVEKEAEIKKLQEQIKAKKESKSKFQSELSETAKKIASVQNNFEATYIFLSNQIKEDLNKIKQHLK